MCVHEKAESEAFVMSIQFETFPFALQFISVLMSVFIICFYLLPFES